MNEQRLRITGLRGLDGYRYSEESQASPAMRSGYNVELIDNEWWTRPGLQPVRHLKINQEEGCAGLLWWWVVSENKSLTGNVFLDPQEVFLVNPWHAVKFNYTFGGYKPAYSPTETGTMIYTDGSDTGVVTLPGGSTPEVGDLLFFGSSGATTEVRHIISVASGLPNQWTCQLNRKWTTTGISGTSVRLVKPFAPMRVPAAGAVIGGYFGAGWDTGAVETEDGPISIDTGGVAVFEQLVSYTTNELFDASADVPFSHPAIEKNRPYLIVTSKFQYPVAIDMVDDTIDPIYNFFRNTGPTNDKKITPSTDDPETTLGQGRGEYCAVVGNRLFIAKTFDDQERWPLQTFWVSRYGDFTQWHIGLKGKNARASYITLDNFRNEIMQCAPLGNAAVMHRRFSQDTVTLTGSQRNPVRVVKGMEGYGLVNSRSLVATNRGHYMWSQVGPAVFDGTNLNQLGDGIRRHLEAMGMYADRPRNLARSKQALFEREGEGVLFGFEDQTRRQIVWVSKNGVRHSNLSTTNQEDNKLYLDLRELHLQRAAIVYDWASNEWFFKDIPMMVGAGARIDEGQTYSVITMTADGYPYDWNRTDLAKDEFLISHQNAPNGRTQEVPTCYVETGWINLGTETRKALQKVYLELRPWSRRARDGAGIWTPMLDSILYELDDLIPNDETKSFEACRLMVYTDQVDPDGPHLDAISNSFLTGTMRSWPSVESRQPGIMIFETTPRANGMQFKLAFDNTESGTLERAPFRLAAYELVWSETGSGHLRYPANKRMETI